MYPAREVFQHIQENLMISLFYVFAANALVWMLWCAFSTALAWLRIEVGIRRSGVRKGPPSLQILKDSASPRIHRIMEGWVREFGPVFWYRVGPLHVSAPSPEGPSVSF